MKKNILILILYFGFSTTGSAQGLFVIKLITSKVIRAIDLRVQQLQNEAINLAVLQKKLENNFSKASLEQISAWQQKQKDLYAGYFDELTKVKTAIAFTSRISEVVQKQKQMVSDTRKLMQLIYADTHFSPSEAQQFVSACETLLDGSTSNLSLMLQIVSAGQFSMNDAQRLEGLMQAADQVEAQETKLNDYLQKIRGLAIAREQRATEIQNIKRIYGFR